MLGDLTSDTARLGSETKLAAVDVPENGRAVSMQAVIESGFASVASSPGRQASEIPDHSITPPNAAFTNIRTIDQRDRQREPHRGYA